MGWVPGGFQPGAGGTRGTRLAPADAAVSTSELVRMIVGCCEQRDESPTRGRLAGQELLPRPIEPATREPDAASLDLIVKHHHALHVIA
jgi:hypothetical protein